jgi:hypothetical protein
VKIARAQEVEDPTDHPALYSAAVLCCEYPSGSSFAEFLMVFLYRKYFFIDDLVFGWGIEEEVLHNPEFRYSHETPIHCHRLVEHIIYAERFACNTYYLSTCLEV